MSRYCPIPWLLALISCIGAPARAQRAPQTAPPSSASVIVTRDLRNFYRAYDQARGLDSSARVTAFRQHYLVPGSPGLQDWALLRLAEFDAIAPRLMQRGWTAEAMPRAYAAPTDDSLRQRLMRDLTPLVQQDAAERLAAITARMPAYFDGIRERVLLYDSSAAFRTTTTQALARLQSLAPGRTLPPVYLVVGRLTSGGTASRSGMLIGAELSARTTTTPVHELSASQRSMIADRPPEALTALIVHEAVHTLQSGNQSRSLLSAVIMEGAADFLAYLALGDSSILASSHQQYGRAHEASLKQAFGEALARGDNSDRWLYNWGRTDHMGAPDLGYFIGFRICEAYYARAQDKAAALAALLDGADPERVLRESGYLPVGD